jgi:hypothetical protein
MASLEEVTKVMTFLAALWPRERVTKATIKAYAKVLEDLPADALMAAAEKMAGESTFFPKAAELRQAAFQLIQGDELPLAMEGWEQVTRVWSGQSVEFHRLTKAAVRRMGGMSRLGQTRDKDLPFVRAQFIKTFEGLREREIEDRRQLPAVRRYKELEAERRTEIEIKRLAEKMAGNGQAIEGGHDGSSI